MRPFDHLDVFSASTKNTVPHVVKNPNDGARQIQTTSKLSRRSQPSRISGVNSRIPAQNLLFRLLFRKSVTLSKPLRKPFLPTFNEIHVLVRKFVPLVLDFRPQAVPVASEFLPCHRLLLLLLLA